MTKSVSTQWAIRVTTDQIHKCEDAFKKYSFIGYVREIGSETEKAHYHIAIQFDEPKDDNSVRYVVKKFFQVKGNGLYSIKVWDGLPAYVAYFYKGYPDVVPVMIGSYDGHVPPEEYYQMHLARVEELKKAQAPKKTVSYDKVIQACIHRVKKMSAERDWKYSEDEHLKHQITKVYLEELRTHDLPAKNLFAMRGDVIKIMFAVGDKVLDNTLCQMIMKGL